MTFSAFELSRYLSKKVALYTFSRGGAFGSPTVEVVYRFTTHTSDVVRAGKTYISARGMSHSAIRVTPEKPKTDITINVPYLLDPTAAVAAEAPVTQALGDWWRPYPPSELVQVTVATTHIGDTDEEVATEWIGRVAAPKYTDNLMTLRCEPSLRRNSANGRIPIAQRGCWVPLYSQGPGMCNVVKSLHAVNATLTGVSSLTLTAAAFGTAPKNLAGGSLEWLRPDGLTDRRTIRTHSGTTITIDYAGEDLAVSLAVTAYPNCPHNTDGCASFSNSINYPGFPNLPTNEPMARSQAW